MHTFKCPMRSTKYIHVSNVNPSYIQTITITLESSLMILLRKSLLPLLSEAMTILILFQLALRAIEFYIKGITVYILSCKTSLIQHIFEIHTFCCM